MLIWSVVLITVKMPYKRRRIGRGSSAARFKKRRSRRNSSRRARRTHGSLMRVPRNMTGMADQVMVKLRYCQEIPLTTALGLMSVQVFRANSIFDPDLTGVGHQPRWRDQWTPFFSRYNVYASKITLRVVTSETEDAARIYVIASKTSTSPGANDFCEYTGVKQRMISPGQTQKTFSAYRSSKSVLGAHIANSFDTSAAVGTNPAHEWFWHIGVSNINFVAALTVKVEFTIIYYVKFLERQQATQS